MDRLTKDCSVLCYQSQVQTGHVMHSARKDHAFGEWHSHGQFPRSVSFSLLPLQPYFVSEVRCFVLFRNCRGGFEIVFLLRFVKQSF